MRVSARVPSRTHLKLCSVPQMALLNGGSLPSFFVVGPPRTGTSWLHHILKGRAVLPRVKETRFFDVHFHRGTDWYQRNYAGTAGYRGEIAPTYFASPQACQRIRELVPAARIACIFRNPVERILSLYRLKRAYGMIPWGFDEAIRRDPELMESSRYATYLKIWRQAFGKENLHTAFFEDLRDGPQGFVNSLADFIGLPRFQLTGPEVTVLHTSVTMTHPRSYRRTRHANQMADWLKARQLGQIVSMVKRSPVVKLLLGGGPAFVRPSWESLQMTYELFRSEISELEALTGRDLSQWKRAPTGGSTTPLPRPESVMQARKNLGF